MQDYENMAEHEIPSATESGKAGPKTLLVIAGPTAVGKTALCVKLAQHYKTEVISADARQFYKEMLIGTARPTPGEMQGVTHHFVASHSIHNPLNAGQYADEALALIDTLFEKHNLLILTGGSGMYIKAVCEGLDNVPSSPEHVRTELQNLFEAYGVIALQNLLKEKDPEYYSKVDTSNPQRMMRALEVCIATGMPYSTFLGLEKPPRPFNIIKIGLNLPRPELYARIDTRVDLMMQAGQEAEALSLYPSRNLVPLQTVGYSEIFNYFDGHSNYETAIGMIKQNTRRYAKRQLTWFNKDEKMKWFAPAQAEEIINYVDLVIGEAV
ncbi:MAG: tRNA (adenosine(37)-N6)-dimethylallyltransferase MiaA [Bacteroidota bacterium]